jgi:hypothetical protein
MSACARQQLGRIMAVASAAALVALVAPGAAGAAISGHTAPAASNSTGLVGYLITIPNLSNKTLTSLEGDTADMALGVMGSIVTISVFMKFLAGRGGVELVDELRKATIAVALVVSYKWLYPDVVSLANLAAQGILGLDSSGSNTNLLSQVGLNGSASILGLLSGNVIGWLANVVIMLTALFALVCVLIMKVVISAITVLLYPAGPVVLALWPIEGARWITGTATKAGSAALLVPAVWTLIVKSFIVFNSVAVTQGAINGVLGGVGWSSLTRAAVAFALLYALIVIPKGLLREASGGGGGGGVLRQTISFTTSSMASHAIGRGAGRLTDAIRGPQGTITSNASGQTVSVHTTQTARGRKLERERQALNGSSALLEAANVWPQPGEPQGRFEGRLAAMTPSKAPIENGAELRQRLGRLTATDRKGLRSAYRQHVEGEGGGPGGDYPGFYAGVGAELAKRELPGGYRDAYRAVTRAAPSALREVLGSGGAAGAAPGAPAGDDVPPTGTSPRPAAPPAPAVPAPAAAAPAARSGPPAGGIRVDGLTPPNQVRVRRLAARSFERFGDESPAYNDLRGTLNALAWADETPEGDRPVLRDLAGADNDTLKSLRLEQSEVNGAGGESR